MKESKGILKIGVVGLFLITFTCGLVYLVSQQTLRLNANAVPNQIAVDTSIKLEKSSNTQELISEQSLDISKSQGAFVMVYDSNKNLIATTGMLGSIKPTYPSGVLDYLDKHNEDRVTWQPEDKLRFATVGIKYKNGYIVAAQSLSETEKTIQQIGYIVLLAWLSAIVFQAIILFIFHQNIKKEKVD
jgi:hypothetical protein